MASQESTCACEIAASSSPKMLFVSTKCYLTYRVQIHKYNNKQTKSNNSFLPHKIVINQRGVCARNLLLSKETYKMSIFIHCQHIHTNDSCARENSDEMRKMMSKLLCLNTNKMRIDELRHIWLKIYSVDNCQCASKRAYAKEHAARRSSAAK